MTVSEETHDPVEPEDRIWEGIEDGKQVRKRILHPGREQDCTLCHGQEAEE